MRERARELRDRTVWVLARLSLAMLLSIMAALFVSSAGQGQPASEDSPVVEQQPVERAREGVLDQASPLGIVLVGVVVVGGVGVLLVGAFKPQRRHSSHDLAHLLRD